VIVRALIGVSLVTAPALVLLHLTAVGGVALLLVAIVPVLTAATIAVVERADLARSA